MVELVLNLDTIDTPAALLELDRLRANCTRMTNRVRTRGSRLRPHLKTLKAANVLPYALDPAHGGIAVSTLNEGEYFARHGVKDIQLALCLPPTKLARAADLTATCPGFSFFCADIGVAKAAIALNRPLNIWIEIDCGEHRTGVMSDDPVLLELGRLIASAPHLTLQGVATHAGHAYHLALTGAIAELAAVERDAVLMAANRLRDAGIAVEGVSAGSTPTAVHGEDFTGLTEVRAGVYMAGDLFQSGIGSMAESDIAFSVLATVIAHDRIRNRIVIDAGGLALSKDRGTAGLTHDWGYGKIVDFDGGDRFGDMKIVDTHQEHGEIARCSDRLLPFDELPIGAKLRVLVNHACMTAAMYNELLVIKDDSVSERWPRVNGWN
jgi:D-serine deaminase-like pyridoxal phosphate-dependent protein